MRITFMSIIWTIFALALSVCALATIRPAAVEYLQPYALYFPFVHITGVRGMAALAFLLAALLFFVLGIARKKLLKKGAASFFLALVFLATSLGHIGIMTSRGLEAPSTLTSASESEKGTITALEYNTQGGKLDIRELASVIINSHAQIVTLPETAQTYGRKLAEELEARSQAYQLFTNHVEETDAHWNSTAVLIAQSLGEYYEDTEAGFGKRLLRLVSKDGGLAVIAVHPQAPHGWRVSSWRSQIEDVYSLCGLYPDSLIIGDFNSTADHQEAVEKIEGEHTSACQDALTELGSGGYGTWPSSLPGILGAPIDRAFIPHGWKASEAAFVELSGSDHRGVLVRMVKQ